ncbi:MAG: nuclear transport factor 2 family protein [Hymenobacter sp.]
MGAALSKGDMTAFGKYMAPDYVHYNPGGGNGGGGGRAEELAYLTSWKDTSMKLISPVKVMRQGNMAVTVATSTFSGIVEGKPFKNNIQMMIAWVLRDGQWQMAVVHSKEMKG